MGIIFKFYLNPGVYVTHKTLIRYNSKWSAVKIFFNLDLDPSKLDRLSGYTKYFSTYL